MFGGTNDEGITLREHRVILSSTPWCQPQHLPKVHPQSLLSLLPPPSSLLTFPPLPSLFVPPLLFIHLSSSRCVVISSSPIVGEGEGENEGQSTLLVIPPLSPHHAIHNPHAIHVLQFDQSLSVAPKGKCMYKSVRAR